MFLGTQETIVYRLAIRNSSYDAYFSFFTTFGGKMGVAPSVLLIMDWGLQTRPKSLPTGWTFWANRYLDIIFSHHDFQSCILESLKWIEFFPQYDIYLTMSKRGINILIYLINLQN